MIQPLVSVMIPCYNATKSLPWTLASLLSQTYTNWECIIVDDGSRDNPKAIIDLIFDERIKFHRFEKNKGRGAARQQALDMAQGNYLCMLDADDWIYPWKIQRQVEFMDNNLEIAVLSSGMAIVDASNDIVGTRGHRSGQGNYTLFDNMQSPDAPTISFAPSMLRADIAKEFRFDTEFKVAEDKDFLLRILMENSYGVLHDVLYVYAEIESITLDKITSSLSNNRRMYLKYLTSFPTKSLKTYIASYTKEMIYRSAFLVGYGDHLINRRSSEPTAKQKEDFEIAYRIVMQTYRYVSRTLKQLSKKD